MDDDEMVELTAEELDQLRSAHSAVEVPSERGWASPRGACACVVRLLRATSLSRFATFSDLNARTDLKVDSYTSAISLT